MKCDDWRYASCEADNYLGLVLNDLKSVEAYINSLIDNRESFTPVKAQECLNTLNCIKEMINAAVREIDTIPHCDDPLFDRIEKWEKESKEEILESRA